MSDPFWDEVNKALPRARRGEPGWAHQRARVLTTLHGSARFPLASVLAAGMAAAALVLVFRNKPAPPAEPSGSAMMPADDLEFLEMTPLLEHLDELQDSEELDHA